MVSSFLYQITIKIYQETSKTLILIDNNLFNSTHCKDQETDHIENNVIFSYSLRQETSLFEFQTQVE